MTNFLQKPVSNKKDYERIVKQERLILELSESICSEVKRQRKTLSFLASKLKKTKGYISQLLTGDRNMTLRTLSDLAYALDMDVELTLKSTKEDWVMEHEHILGRPLFSSNAIPGNRIDTSENLGYGYKIAS